MDKFFKWFTEGSGNPDSMNFVRWFAKNYEPENFEGIDRLLMCYIKYCSKLSIVPCRNYLIAYLKADGKQDIKKHNVKTDTMTSYDYREASQLEEAYRVISDLAINTYDSYLQEDLEGRDFKVDMYEFMTTGKSEAIQKAMMDCYPKLMDGTDTTEVSSMLQNKLSNIDEIYDRDKISEIDLINSGDGEEEELHFLAKTGISCIDGDLGGIYTRLIVTLDAQPAGGKTRMALANFVYPVLVEAKKDVLFYELELMNMQVKNILIAYHITRLYNGKIKIPDSLMNKKDEMTEEQRRIYEAAKIDLFESGRYGKFIYKSNLVVEKYRDEALAIIKQSGNLGLICIDYMGLCKSEPTSRYEMKKDRAEIITDAYITTKDILKVADVAALCINQYSAEGIKAALAGKPIQPDHIQGGQIVQRHTDYDINLTFTEEQKLAGVCMAATGKTRGTAGFSNVLLSKDLAVSIFRQEADV